MSRETATSRRHFLGLGAWAGIVPCLPASLVACSPQDRYWWRAPEGPFHHGVASGDPLSDRVILWTRVTAPGLERAEVQWLVAADEAFEDIIAKGRGTTSAEVDFTFKVDVTGLSAETTYYYRFNFEGTDSPIGRTRTLPKEGVERVRVAAVSCSNFPAGFFHVYQALSEEENIDAVLHLGDYLYEYSSRGYASAGSKGRGRVSEPSHELLSVEDYRIRHGQYRSDLSLQACHAKHPFIVVWDDHEVANNSYQSGADNHEAGEGSFTERKAAAVQVWFEWMPVRPPRGGSSKIYRRFDFGGLVNLLMLDTRLVGREKQLSFGEFRRSGSTDADETRTAVMEESRTLLGDEQRQWLERNLSESTARWQLLGQQVLMARYELPVEVVDTLRSKDPSREALLVQEIIPRVDASEEGEPVPEEEKIPYNLDAWDGYAAERDAILGLIKENGQSLIVFAGDTHNAWVSRLTTSSGESVGAEFGTPSVSSPGFESRLGAPGAEALAGLMKRSITDLLWADFSQRGYVVVTFEPQGVRADFEFVSSVKEESFYRYGGAAVTVFSDLSVEVA